MRVLQHSRWSIPASAGQPVDNLGMSLDAGVYPRECGATSQALKGRVGNSGLSPRVRGNPCGTARWWAYRRSIPASAGQPPIALSHSRLNQVYPRECGATLLNRDFSNDLTGLSPRVRGNHLMIGTPLDYIGSIPASAGQPLRGPRRPAGMEVYPRECGATVNEAENPTYSCGLSPRVRGNPGRPR